MTGADREVRTVGTRLASRVAIAINPPGDYGDVLDAAARLAARLEAELEAVLVEDPGLLDVARLPFTRTIDVSGRERALDDRTVQRAWQAERRRVDSAIRRCVAGLNVRSSLRTVKGRFVSEALTVASQVDVTMLVHPRSFARSLSSTERAWLQARPGARSPPRQIARRPRPVWVLFDGSPASERAVELAAQLAADSHLGLLVLYPGAGDPHALRERVRDRIGARSVPITHVAAAGHALDVLAAVRRPEGCALVVVPRDAVDATSLPGVLDLLATRLCPLVLVA